MNKKNTGIKARAIRDKCLECSGDSPKEVTLCHIFDCPLWPFRIGASIESKQYKKRISLALRRYRKDLEELQAMDVDVSIFLLHSPKSRYAEKNDSLDNKGGEGKRGSKAA